MSEPQNDTLKEMRRTIRLLEGMTSLVDKSLLRQAGDAELRCTMLETIREYAAETLTEQGEAIAIIRPLPHGRDSESCSTCFDRSAGIGISLFQFSSQPHLGQLPISHDGDGRDVQYLGGFFHAQSPEKPQFHDLSLPGILGCKGL